MASGSAEGHDVQGVLVQEIRGARVVQVRRRNRQAKLSVADAKDRLLTEV